MGRTLGAVLDSPAPAGPGETGFLDPGSEVLRLGGVKNFDMKNVEKAAKLPIATCS